MPTWPWCQCCQCCPPAWPKLVDNIGMLRAVEPQWVVVEGWIFCEGTPGRTGVRPRPEVRPRPGFLPFRRVWLEYKTNKNGSAMGIYSVTHPAHCNFLFVFLLDLPPGEPILLLPRRAVIWNDNFQMNNWQILRLTGWVTLFSFGSSTASLGLARGPLFAALINLFATFYGPCLLDGAFLLYKQNCRFKINPRLGTKE